MFHKLMHAKVEERDEVGKNKETPLALSSIMDTELTEALAPFDVDGNGRINLVKVHDAAKGHLHWSDDRPMAG